MISDFSAALRKSLFLFPSTSKIFKNLRKSLFCENAQKPYKCPKWTFLKKSKISPGHPLISDKFKQFLLFFVFFLKNITILDYLFEVAPKFPLDPFFENSFYKKWDFFSKKTRFCPNCQKTVLSSHFVHLWNWWFFDEFWRQNSSKSAQNQPQNSSQKKQVFSGTWILWGIHGGVFSKHEICSQKHVRKTWFFMIFRAPGKADFRLFWRFLKRKFVLFYFFFIFVFFFLNN